MCTKPFPKLRTSNTGATLCINIVNFFHDIFIHVCHTGSFPTRVFTL